MAVHIVYIVQMVHIVIFEVSGDTLVFMYVRWGLLDFYKISIFQIFS